MKKLLVVLLVVVLTLSLATMASASTFGPALGGRIAWTYVSTSDDAYLKDAPATFEQGSGIKLQLLMKLNDEATGTWGNIGAKIDGWGNSGTGKAGASTTLGVNSIYDFGVKKIGGSDVNIWYTSWENENMKRGQGRINDMDFGKYNEDPFFDHTGANMIGIDYITDSLTINFGYQPNKASTKTLSAAAQTEIDGITGTTPDDYAKIAGIKAADANYTYVLDKANVIATSATFKFDGGDVHLGYWGAGNETTYTTVGGSFKAGIVTLSADYNNNAPKVGNSVNQTQIGANFDDLKLNITYMSDNKVTFTKTGGVGYKIAYSGLADGKMTIAYRALTADKVADEGSNLTDFYIGYKYGIFETRLGSAVKGTTNAGGEKKYTYASCYCNFW